MYCFCLIAVPFVYDMAFVIDMVHGFLLLVQVLQDAWVPTVVFHAGLELLKRQARRHKVFL